MDVVICPTTSQCTASSQAPSVSTWSECFVATGALTSIEPVTTSIFILGSAPRGPGISILSWREGRVLV